MKKTSQKKQVCLCECHKLIHLCSNCWDYHYAPKEKQCEVCDSAQRRGQGGTGGHECGYFKEPPQGKGDEWEECRTMGNARKCPKDGMKYIVDERCPCFVYKHPPTSPSSKATGGEWKGLNAFDCNYCGKEDRGYFCSIDCAEHFITEQIVKVREEGYIEGQKSQIPIQETLTKTLERMEQVREQERQKVLEEIVSLATPLNVGLGRKNEPVLAIKVKELEKLLKTK